MGEIGSFVRRKRSRIQVTLVLWIGGVWSFVRRYRSGGWEETERLYVAVREKSIDFLKILYRLSGNTL